MATKLYIIITVDTEDSQRPPVVFDPEVSELESMIYGKTGNQYYGFPKIMDICHAYGCKATYFVSVFEHAKYGQKALKEVCQEIRRKDHDVQLHTHPQRAYDKQKYVMHQYPLQKQIQILRDGKELLKEWIGEYPVAHRAGAYGLSKETLVALKEAGIPIDASVYRGSSHSKEKFTVNKVAEQHGIIEVPVTCFERTIYLNIGPSQFKARRAYIKTDIDVLNLDELLWFVEQAKQHNIRVMTLFLHSYSLIKFDPHNNDYQPDYQDAEKFDRFLATVTKDPEIQFITMKGFYDLYQKNPDIFLSGSNYIAVQPKKFSLRQIVGHRLSHPSPSPVGLKLLYISNASFESERAHGYQALKVCEAFTKNNAQVELVLTPGIRLPKTFSQLQKVWQHYGIKKRFAAKELPSFDLQWLDSYASRHRAQKLGRLYAQLQSTSFNLLAVLYTLFKQTDIYYTREHSFALLMGYLRFWHGKNIYYEVHKFEPRVSRLVNRLVKSGGLAGLVVINQRLEELYLKQGVPEAKILVAPDGVDLSMFDGSIPKENARKELGIPPDKKIVCYTGHLYDWKGVYILAMSLKNLPPDCTAYFVGGLVQDIQRFKRFTQENTITNAVVVGHVSPVKIPQFLAAADVVVLPNIEGGLSEYTSPLKLFEYMASKRPIVASDLPAIREILNEENAVLVEPGNPQAMAEGINKVLSNQELANRIVEKAYQDVQQYGWKRRAQRILEFMEKGHA